MGIGDWGLGIGDWAPAHSASEPAQGRNRFSICGSLSPYMNYKVHKFSFVI